MRHKNWSIKERIKHFEGKAWYKQGSDKIFGSLVVKIWQSHLKICWITKIQFVTPKVIRFSEIRLVG